MSRAQALHEVVDAPDSAVAWAAHKRKADACSLHLVTKQEAGAFHKS